MGSEKDLFPRHEIRQTRSDFNQQQIKQENQQELDLRKALDKARDINDEFAEKQLRKQKLRMEIGQKREELKSLEKELDLMANKIKSEKIVLKH